ncbi:hypothetical protein CKO12_13855 [Chromatium okenii]|nr:hypothetical protein [Chromatium okenii]
MVDPPQNDCRNPRTTFNHACCAAINLFWIDYTVRADLGFLGLVNDYGFKSDIRLPNKKPRKSKNNLSPELTKQQKIENRAHAQRRIFVEHSIGGMKHFHCLTHRIRSQSNVIMDQFFGLAAGLWNFNIS